MKSLNKVMLIGNLTRDPEVREVSNGTAVADLSLAMNRFVPDGDQKREEATFVDVVVWNRQAEMAGRYLKKGRKVYVEGRLQLDVWQDRKTGETRRKLRVVGERLEFADPPPAGDADREEAEPSAERRSAEVGPNRDGHSRRRSQVSE